MNAFQYNVCKLNTFQCNISNCFSVMNAFQFQCSIFKMNAFQYNVCKLNTFQCNIVIMNAFQCSIFKMNAFQYNVCKLNTFNAILF